MRSQGLAAAATPDERHRYVRSLSTAVRAVCACYAPTAVFSCFCKVVPGTLVLVNTASKCEYVLLLLYSSGGACRA